MVTIETCGAAPMINGAAVTAGRCVDTKGHPGDHFLPLRPGAFYWPNLAEKDGTGIPTNAELAEKAKSLDVHAVVRNWIDRHAGAVSVSGFNTRDEWLNWAARNFLADPEIAQHLCVISPADQSRADELAYAVRDAGAPEAHALARTAIAVALAAERTKGRRDVVSDKREPVEILGEALRPWACCGSPNLCGAECQDNELSDALARAERLVRPEADKAAANRLRALALNCADHGITS